MISHVRGTRSRSASGPLIRARKAGGGAGPCLDYTRLLHSFGLSYTRWGGLLPTTTTATMTVGQTRRKRSPRPPRPMSQTRPLRRSSRHTNAHRRPIHLRRSTPMRPCPCPIGPRPRPFSALCSASQSPSSPSPWLRATSFAAVASPQIPSRTLRNPDSPRSDSGPGPPRPRSVSLTNPGSRLHSLRSPPRDPRSRRISG